MRILHCIPSMAGGGAERQLSYLAAGLVARGVETHVALTRRGENFAQLENSGAVVHEIGVPGNHSLRLPIAIRRLVRRLRPDMVQTWLTQMDIAAGAVALGSRVPWILSERNSAASYPPSWKNRLRQWLGRRASAVISNSQSGCDYWNERLPARVPRLVISNALPFSVVDRATPIDAQQSGVETGEKLVLYVGRLHSTKNLGMLLEALKRVATQMPLKAVLCGEGPERAALEQSIADLGLAGIVRLQGYVSNPWQWMKRADVFVSPSFVEGHPNTVMEAMACGVPLVVSDIATHREFLDARCACLVDPHSASLCAEGILDTLRWSDRARSRSGAAREKAKLWSVDRMTDRYLEAYGQILDSLGRSDVQVRRGNPAADRDLERFKAKPQGAS